MYKRLIKKKGTRRFNGILKHYDDNNILKLNLTAGKGASEQLQKDIDRIIHKIFKDIEAVLIENGLEVKSKNTYRKNNKKIRGFIPYNCEKCGEDKRCMLLKNSKILCNECMKAENEVGGINMCNDCGTELPTNLIYTGEILCDRCYNGRQ